jgi:hypothetical protein
MAIAFKPQLGLVKETMTKSESFETKKTVQYGKTLGADYMARALSALYRAARNTRSKVEILEVAIKEGVTAHPEFIICAARHAEKELSDRMGRLAALPIDPVRENKLSKIPGYTQAMEQARSHKGAA